MIIINIKMSQLNLFQKFTEQQQFRSLQTLSNGLSAILDYCEYSIHGDFNANDKLKFKNKNRKRQISVEFITAFNTLSREEKIEYYIRVVGYLRKFINEDFQPPKSPYSGILNDIGYSRSFNIKRWKDKKLRLDQDRHIMFAEREVKIKTYQMKDYMLRISKNKEYFSFVLEAINNNPPEKSRTVHIGFSDKSVFQKWYQSIKFSVEFREWQLYCFLYRGKGPKLIQRSATDDLKLMSKSFYSESLPSNRKDSVNSQEDFMSTSMMIEPNKRTQFQFNPIINEKQQMKPQVEPKKAEVLSQQQIQMHQLQQQIKEYQVKQEEAHVRRTLVDDLIDGQVFQQPDVFEEKIEQEDEKSKEGKRHLDLFHKIYPEYELQQLQIYLNYSIIHQEENLKIYQNQILQKRLKMVLNFSKEKHSADQIMSMISKVETLKELNQNIQEMQLKTNIPSQNSALIYLVLKPFNRLYRSRDFIFIRHVFKSGKQIYMVDKSIENTNYPPFMTIVRGSLCIVYGLFERENQFQLIVDVEITNQGYLNLVQETNLTLKYLKGFSKLSSATIQVNSYKLFSLDWDISKNEANHLQNQIRSRRKTINEINKKISQSQQKKQVEKTPEPAMFVKKSPVAQLEIAKPQKEQVKQQVKKQSSEEKSPQQKQTSISQHRDKDSKSPNSHTNLDAKHNPPSHHNSNKNSNPNSNQNTHQKVEVKRFDKKSMEQIGEISAEQIKKGNNFKTNLSIIRQLDKNGMVIIEKDFLKHHYILEPLEKEKSKLIFMDTSEGNPIWKNQWIHDDKEGSMIFIHKKKIEDQKGVLKFILSKMAKNLVSGQSVLSISLPVDIFSAESNLQRFIYSMLYAPLILEGIQKESPISKLVKTIIFGLTNSVLYLSMEKPFNPILGETFQCWINGCPAYAEQISHHPPIGALMLKGRGYQITAQLQSKVSLGVNSGTGTNDGIYRVRFQDKTEVCFITPGGEVSGLSHGDRKFNLVGKSHYWITNTNIMLQIAFDPFKKGFFSVGKQQQPSDYFEGIIYEVKPQFMTKFLNGKRKEPDEKDRLKSYGKISGIWNKYFKYNNQEIFNFEKQFPLILEHEPHPIPSDANWRQDIEYRKRNQITRAQTEKERLEVLQRKDRKLREKANKHK